ncbi:DUF2953 domain-containing protein [Sediminibacillus massiliensis]|uniref:DUF2953 domain-containing protein n=1 Tax=Sediminibacillus massiliensis TaxID=1926277 RepID=UPI0009885D5F|nr:DUF2953 domain-containing protein [Sediminibacillus massiliensis]
MAWLVVLIVLFLLFILSLFLRIYTTISFVYENGKEQWKFQVRIINITIYKKEIGDEQADEKMESIIARLNPDEPGFIENMKARWIEFLEMRQMVHRLIPRLLKLFSKTKVHSLKWHTKIGTGEASSTGMITGGIWALKQILVGWMKKNMKKVNQTVVFVDPIFKQKYAGTHFICMFSVRLGHAILAIIYLSSLTQKQKQTHKHNQQPDYKEVNV